MKDTPKEFARRFIESFNEEEFEKLMNKIFLSYDKNLGMYVDKGAVYYDGEIKGV